MKQETVSVRDAAQRMGVTLKYIYDLIYSGKIQANKIGRQWRISTACVQERLKQRGQ